MSPPRKRRQSGTRKRMSPKAQRELELYEQERERARAARQLSNDVSDAADARPAPELPDPTVNRIGKFSGPDAGAPGTQRDAAILVYPRTGTARSRVLQLILDVGDYGITDEEGMAKLRMAQNTYRPRRNELLNDGWVIDSGKRRATLSGAAAVAWIASPAGRAATGGVRSEPAPVPPAGSVGVVPPNRPLAEAPGGMTDA